MKKKISDIISIALFLALIVGFSVTFFVLPDKASSEVEGRELQQAPSFSTGYTDTEKNVDYVGTDYLFHGKLADQFDEYYCDQFPMRNMFLGLSALTEVSFGRNVKNGVLYKNGDLAVTRFDAVGVGASTEYYSQTHVMEGLENLNELCGTLQAPVSVLLPPRSIDVKAESMGYPTELSDQLNKLIADNLDGKYYVDLLGTMRSLYNSGKQPYFKTDHHWTVVGAYHAYAALMESWGVTPYAMEDFNFEAVTDSFRGTSLRNGNYFFMDGEELCLARYEGDEDFTVTELNLAFAPGKELDGLYGFDALETEDAYSTFLHGKPTHLSITLEGAERETLLVLKDSFGHSLVPFLARHYDIVIVDIDTSRFGTSVSYLANKFNPDRVLIVYNLENVIETDKLSRFA